MNISAIIPTYNRANTLKRAVKSVLRGSLKPKELIVIDDGSVDNTADILKGVDISYIYQPNSGVSAARNLGIKNASYEWIAFLDSDDEWHKDKLLKQSLFHEQNSEILCSQTQEIWKVNGKFKNQPKRYQKQAGYIFETLMRVCSVTTSSFLAHRSVFDKIGLFDEDLEVCEDQDLYLRAAKEYEFGLIDEPLITKHAGEADQLSFTTDLMDIYRIKALLKHLDSKAAREEIRKKCDILLKGALKRDNEKIISFVRTSLDRLQDTHL